MRLIHANLELKKPVPQQGRAKTRGTTPLLSIAERFVHAIVHAPSITEGQSGLLTVLRHVQLAAQEGFSSERFCPASTIPVR
ncbi:MAG: hypothetical protein VB026_04245 [Anaerolineaceae bacterium]|nr:hypothetical protein [Anaerolineaceae bacterium]